MIKEIKGYPNYFITEDGRVISKKSKNPKELCQWIDGTGYKQVIIRKDGKRYYKRVHQLVADAFVEGKSEINCMVNHIDGNKVNNNFKNLEWTSNKKNTQHAYDNGLYRSTYKCKVKAVHKITGEEFVFRSIRACAKELDLNRKTITEILKKNKNNNYDYYFEYMD